MTTQAAVLVFPMNTSKSESFSRMANRLGLRVVAASSDLADQRSDSGIAYLPYITEPNFDAELLKLIQNENISFIYTRHAAVWLHMHDMKEKGLFHCEICNEYPVDENWVPYSKAYFWADQCADELDLISRSCSASLPKNIYAGLHHSFNMIPGESDDNKLWLLTQIARFSPKGDVVEIGSAYGRSAYALALLAKSHFIGSVVCVDPWDLISSQNQGDKASLINKAVKSVKWDELFAVFCAELAVFDNVNYIRLPSHLAVSRYCDAAEEGFLNSPEFGSIPVSGKIAILHIDGNHRYEDVMLDIDNWVPNVMPGGWILLDDYLWAFGDGPKIAGDQLLKNIKTKTSFVVGDTLCIQV